MVGTQKDPKAKGMDDNDPKNKPPEKDDKGSNGKNCCKKVLKFMFSHIGLCGMVIAYSVAGGFIFRHLEMTNEEMECTKALEKYTPAENDTMEKIHVIGQNFQNPDDKQYALAEYQKVLRSFRSVVLDLGYDGKNCSAYGMVGGPSHDWNLAGAMLFSVTVITTIGYGNIAPKTFWGRLVCIAYAVLGIPLMLLCLANIGDVLADVFRFIYTKVCCCGCCRRKDKNRVEALKNDEAKGAAGGGVGAGGAAGAPPGAGRRTPEAWKNHYAQQQQKQQQEKGGPVVVDDDDDDEEDEDEKISVPLTITMAIIAVYIGFGALLFGVWEGWDVLKASYFCFVTVSTIGFGDVVPGSANFETEADNWKIIGALVYSLFGMAILSMCFSLIQEEIVAKFRWVGEKIGIIEKEKDENEDDDNDDEEKSKQSNKGAVPPPNKQQPPPPMKGQPGMAPGMPPSKHGMPPSKAGPPGGYPPMKPGVMTGPPPPPMMPAGPKGPMPPSVGQMHRPPPPPSMAPPKGPPPPP